MRSLIQAQIILFYSKNWLQAMIRKFFENLEDLLCSVTADVVQ